MQTQKEYIQSAILAAAGQEFIEKGYTKASLRTIALKAGVTLSNIYNYFRDKDALFCELLLPYRRKVEEAKRMLEVMESDHAYATESEHLDMLDIPIRYVNENKAMFKLLLFGAEGSSLANYQDTLIKWFGEVMQKTQEGIVERHEVRNELASETIFNHIGSMWVNFICDSIKNDMEPDEILHKARELMRFVYHGWIGFLGVKITE